MNMLDPHAVLVELNTVGTSNSAVHDAAVAIRDALERFAVMDARKLAGDLVRETETNMGPALKRLEGLAVAAKDAAAGVTAAPPAGLRPGQSVGDVATAGAPASDVLPPLQGSALHDALVGRTDAGGYVVGEYDAETSKRYVQDYNVGGPRHRPELSMVARMPDADRARLTAQFDSPRSWLKTNGFGDDYLNAKEVPNDWAGFLAQAGIQ
jgi:hypothetical protein